MLQVIGDFRGIDPKNAKRGADAYHTSYSAFAVMARDPTPTERKVLHAPKKEATSTEESKAPPVVQRLLQEAAELVRQGFRLRPINPLGADRTFALAEAPLDTAEKLAIDPDLIRYIHNMRTAVADARAQPDVAAARAVEAKRASAQRGLKDRGPAIKGMLVAYRAVALPAFVKCVESTPPESADANFKLAFDILCKGWCERWDLMTDEEFAKELAGVQSGDFAVNLNFGYGFVITASKDGSLAIDGRKIVVTADSAKFADEEAKASPSPAAAAAAAAEAVAAADPLTAELAALNVK